MNNDSMLNETTALFLIDEEIITLADALSANVDDIEVCEFLNNANVGDIFYAHFMSEAAKRIA